MFTVDNWSAQHACTLFFDVEVELPDDEDELGVELPVRPDDKDGDERDDDEDDDEDEDDEPDDDEDAARVSDDAATGFYGDTPTVLSNMYHKSTTELIINRATCDICIQ